jgi:hypothetical protein
MTNHAICEVWCIYYPCVFLDNPIYPIFCIYVSFLSVWPFFNRMLLLIVPSKVLFIQKFKEFQNSKVFWNIHSCLTLSKIQQLQTPARPRVCSAARQSRVGSYSNNLGRRSAFPIGKELLFWSKGVWENRSSDLTVWNVGTDFSGPKDTHFQVKKKHHQLRRGTCLDRWVSPRLLRGPYKMRSTRNMFMLRIFGGVSFQLFQVYAAISQWNVDVWLVSFLMFWCLVGVFPTI